MTGWRIDNLDLLVHDADRMAGFYHDVLGLPFFLPFEPGQGWFCVQAGDVTIYVFETKVPGAPPRRTDDTDTNPAGIDSFAFAVDDLDEAVARLDGKVPWVGEAERWDHPGGTWYRYRSFFDPEGNILHITEPHPA
jgi:predicted enzyme related to lactoylglutathione lyase